MNTISLALKGASNVLFAGLVYYDADGKTHNDMAESIETTDSKVWTIKVKQGQKFTDGTDVKAENFVNAWKQGAKDNRQQDFDGCVNVALPAVTRKDIAGSGNCCDSLILQLAKQKFHGFPSYSKW